ncbi:hypothetical protein [Aestuariivirga sp.]|uniref:hypothetical protein n=1 Tax=Aestuariivirga sp. TaxID=2650926 RepID=UPI0039E51A42
MKLALFRVHRANGLRIHQVSRKLGITDTTLYTWLKSERESAFDLDKLRRDNEQERRRVALLEEESALFV